MDVLAICRKSFSELRQTPLDSFEVPMVKDENEKPLVVYVRAMNLEQEAKRDTFAQENDFAGFKISTIIACACDENMKPMFSDLPIVRQQFMKEMDTSVINYMSNKIVEILHKHVIGELDEEKKN